MGEKVMVGGKVAVAPIYNAACGKQSACYVNAEQVMLLQRRVEELETGLQRIATFYVTRDHMVSAGVIDIARALLEAGK